MKSKRMGVVGIFAALVVVTGTWATAAEPQGERVTPEHKPGESVEKQDVAGFIFHHVSDTHEYEFEIPLNEGHNPTIAFPRIYIPIKSGAQCPASTGFHMVPAQAAHGGGHGGSGGAGDAHGGHVPGLAEGCLDLSITKHTMMMWLGALILLALFLFGAHKDKSQIVPRGRLANALEMLVLFVRDELAIKNIGKEEGPRYTPYLLSIFFFILTLNLLGLIPWMATATGNLAVTAALATLTFLVTQIASIRAAGIGGYLKHLTGGVHWSLWPIMIPVEILGLFTKPFALTVRLFANMLAGHVVIFFLLGLIFLLNSAALALFSVPLAFAIYLLEIFVAFVQAYVFTMLSALFIGMGVAMGHHHDDHGHGHEKEGAVSHDHGAGHQLSGG